MGKYTFFDFLRAQFAKLPIQYRDLTGANVIITGSNTGLGLAAALHLAKMKPARIILAVRNLEKGDTAAKRVQTDTGFLPEVWELDQASFKSVKAFTDRVNRELTRLDLFLANAGINTTIYGQTEDGWENTIQTNDISTALIGLAVLPLLMKTAAAPLKSYQDLKPHFTITASEVHYWAAFKEASKPDPLKALNQVTKENYQSMERYCVSKVINLLIGRELAKKADDKVVVNTVNPGLCSSELSRDQNAIVAYLMSFLAFTTEVGSRNLIAAALEDQDTSKSNFISACQVKEESDFCLSDEGYAAQANIWRELLSIAKQVYPSQNF